MSYSFHTSAKDLSTYKDKYILTEHADENSNKTPS